MYTGVLYQKRIRNVYISIVYPIGNPSNLYEDNQAKMKILGRQDNTKR